MDDIEINLESAKGKPVALSSETGPVTAAQSQLMRSETQPMRAGSEGRFSGVLSNLDISRSGHPIACMFHLVFKTIAIVA